MQLPYIPSGQIYEPMPNAQILELHRDSHQSMHQHVRRTKHRALNISCSTTARTPADLGEMHQESHQLLWAHDEPSDASMCDQKFIIVRTKFARKSKHTQGFSLKLTREERILATRVARFPKLWLKPESSQLSKIQFSQCSNAYFRRRRIYNTS